MRSINLAAFVAASVCLVQVRPAECADSPPVFERKHIVILYDYSSSVLNEGAKVERTNQYLERLLFDPGPLLAQSPSDLVQVNSLGTESLFHDGDYLSFFAFGMPRTVLDEGLSRLDRQRFWTVFQSNLVHPAVGPDGPLTAQDARAFLRQRLPSRGQTENFWYTLSQYSLTALIAGLPERFATRTLVIHISDLFSGKSAVGTMDRELVRQRAPQLVSVLDAAQNFQNDNFSTRSGLLQLSVGGYQGIKVQIFEVAPHDQAAIYFEPGGCAIRQTPEAWELALPPLAASGVSPAHAQWFQPREATLVVQAGGAPIERRIPDIDALPLDAARTLKTYSLSASEIGYDQRQAAVALRWKVVYQPPGDFGMKLALVLATHTLACQVILQSQAPPLWPWVVSALGILALGAIAYYLCFRPPGVIVEPAEPWFADEDIRGDAPASRIIGNRVYRRVVRRPELRRVPLNWVLKLDTPWTNLRRPTVWLRLDSAPQKAKLTLIAGNIEAGFKENIPLGPVRPGKKQQFGLILDLDGVPEPAFGEHWPLAFDIVYRVGANGTEQMLSDGFVIEEDPGPLWVGVDPGTTGSCIAAGEDGESLELVPLEKGSDDLIMPSWIYISETSERGEEHQGHFSGIAYETGNRAHLRSLTDPERCFFSVKRLLGYKEKQQVRVDDRPKEISGQDLVSMLVQQMIQVVERRYKSKPGAKPPNKLIVAVPNMFTPGKIAQMTKACEVGDIRRVEYIYEAEAVLMYYIGNLRRLAGPYAEIVRDLRNQPTGEMVMILDFGGASLNLTYARVTATGQRTKVDVLQRIGYAFGGNDVDWEIGKLILSKAEGSATGAEGKHTLRQTMVDPATVSFPDKPARTGWCSNRFRFREVCEQLKMEGAARWKNNRKSEIMSPLAGTPSWGGIQCTVTMEEVASTIDYRTKAQDAVRELCELASITGHWSGVHTLLFSGRSTQLPLLIEATHQTLVEKAGDDVHPVRIPDEDLKTSVAWGAAYYALQRHQIALSHGGAMAYYGIVRQNGLERDDSKFVELISPGMPFDESHHCKRRKDRPGLENNSGRVRFYQVTAPDPAKVLADSNAKKYKMGLLAEIGFPPAEPVDRVEITIDEKDGFEASVFWKGRVNKKHSEYEIEDLLDGQGESARWLKTPPLPIG